MKDLVTPKQVAQAIGVSEASLKRWCDKGVIPAIRTAGGHRRIPTNAVVQWIRDSGHTLAHPELLGLPSNTSGGPSGLERSVELLRAALVAGDESTCRQIVINLYLSGYNVVEICDGVIAPTFTALGSAWQHGEIEVYQERRGCEITANILHHLKTLLPPPSPDAPYALGGTLSTDPYTLPNHTVELALLDAGWSAESHGCCNPGATLAAAIKDRKPDLFWLSVSTFDSEEGFLEEYRLIRQAAEEAGVPIVVGGRALGPQLRREMTYSAFCDELRHLTAFARTIAQQAKKAPSAEC